MGIRVLNVKRLNTAAYETSNLIIGTKGKELLSLLEDSINTLKETWKGEDSTDQINNLIKLYNSFSSSFADVSSCNVKIGKMAKDVSKIAIFNGGTPEVLDEVKDVQFEKLELLPDIKYTGIQLDLQKANSAIKNLLDVEGKFKEITNDFNKEKLIIFNEWQDSVDRDNAGEVYNEVSEDLDAVFDKINEVVSSLESAINNYNKLED